MPSKEEPAIQIEGLTKSYGPKRGVFDLGLQVEHGEIFGFLGPNGSGKTTTIRLLMGLIRPDAGRAVILGKDAQRDSVAVHRVVGYLPGEFAVDPHLTGRQMLVYLAHLRGGVDWSYIDELARRLDIDLERPFGQYSRGNKQKVGLIQAFMHRPAVLILDEPTSGLDPLNQETVVEMVRESQAAGATTFLSSHILSEVEEVCHRVGFVREGELLSVSGVHELLALRAHEVDVECSEPLPEDVLAGVAGASDVRIAGNLLHCLVQGEMDALVKALGRFHVRRLTSREPSLNDVFLRMYGGDGTTPIGVSSSDAPALGAKE